MQVGLHTGRLDLAVCGALLGILFLAGIIQFVRLTARAKCPDCGWTMLRNPKGTGPRVFVINPACPHGTQHLFGLKFLPSYGVNPWGVQMLRARKEKRIMCLRCGADYDLRPDDFRRSEP